MSRILLVIPLSPAHNDSCVDGVAATPCHACYLPQRKESRYEDPPPHDPFAQFLAVCSASNLAEARCISSLLQGSSLAKTRAFSRPSRAHGHHLRPSTHC